MQNQTAMQAPAQPAAAQQFDSVTSVTEFDSAASRPRVGEQLRALEFERDATRTSSAPVLREVADAANVARTSRSHSTAEQRTQQRKRRRERLKCEAEELKVSECMHAFVVVHARSSLTRCWPLHLLSLPHLPPSTISAPQDDSASACRCVTKKQGLGATVAQGGRARASGG